MKAILFILLLFGPAAAFAQEKILTAAADPWPPFIDPAHPGGGLSVEIVRAAFQTQGIVIKMNDVPWIRAESGAKAGTYDVLPDIWMTESRKEYFAFSEPYAVNEVKFIKRNGDPFEYTGIASLKGKNIGIIKGYGYSDEFTDSKEFKKEEVTDFIVNLKKLLISRIDLTMEDQIVAKTRITRTDPLLLSKIEFTQNNFSSKNLYLAVGLKHPRQKEIIATFNKGLALIKANGIYEQIFSRYGMPAH